MSSPCVARAPFWRRVASVVCVILAAVFTRADWDPAASAKWVQFPDLSHQGMDVRDFKAGTELSSLTLADDWRCTVTGPITNIHVWGSWYHDLLPQDGHQRVTFVLSIHADIPDPDGTGPLYSMPGAVLWTQPFSPGSYTARQYATIVDYEGWFEPGETPYFDAAGDMFCWQYNFPIINGAFVQEGTPAAPMVYWLEVQAVYPGYAEFPGRYYGWKTSTNHWNDTAVYAKQFAPYTGPLWKKILYPAGHPLQGEGVDLAFVINGNNVEYDFGDAPELPYPTKLASNGARHIIAPQGPFLGPAGDQPDAEGDGQPNGTATGDDLAGATPDDENGVAIPVLQVGVPSSISITVGQAGRVDGWIDWNGDGIWAEPGERVVGASLPVGPNAIPVTAPGPYVGQTFARFRIHTGTAALLPTGLANDGEVEDHAVTIELAQEAYDFGDAPDKPYPTLLANNGARHIIAPQGPFLGPVGDRPDSEGDGQPNATATGDDLAGAAPDDEDGVAIPVLQVGASATINITVGQAGWVDGWVDWNGDGVWAEPGERVFAANLPPGVKPVVVTAPGPFFGQTFARFRIHTGAAPLLPTGPASDGEVEDHAVLIDPTPVLPDPQAKWWQAPDLTTNGIDVCATQPKLLADDFNCTNRTTITNIVVWGSWRYDELPPGGPATPFFTLSIHSDIPAGVGHAWSMPGPTLWWRTFATGAYSMQVERSGLHESWYNPQSQEFVPWTVPGDAVCYRYTFPVPVGEAFVQTGSVSRPIIYWLDVQASPNGTGAEQFGWKTSTTHWNDDAAWALGSEPYNGAWNELRYPTGHPMKGQSIDLAFALYGMPVAPEPTLDFGDATDPTYPTLLASNGARHTLSSLFLGAAIDAEADGQPNVGATGDDMAGIPNDEDGIVPVGLPWIPAGGGSVTCVSSGTGFLDAWVDFNADGDWSDAGEQIAISLPVVAGVNAVGFPVPGGAVTGATYARFRLSGTGGLSYIGAAPDGEVEDYLVTIGEPALDFGDAPDSANTPRYPTLLANNGARHYLRGVLWMGAQVDTELDGQPNPAASGDDLAGVDDEDGVVFVTSFYRGETVQMQVTASAAGLLDAWVDLNGDSDWTDAGEQMATALPVVAGPNTVTFFVPGTATKGLTYARFRVSTAGTPTPAGLADDGEVEDYEVTIEDRFPPTVGAKWLQPPDLVYGLDIQSWRGVQEPSGLFLVADDWWCDGRPIDAIRWWGSYLSYGGVSNAPGIPVGGVRPWGFRLHWYTDVPATSSPTGYSMPGAELLRQDAPLLAYTQPLTTAGVVKESYAGTVDLGFLGPAYAGQKEHKFRYDLYLTNSWNEKAERIYWLGVEALYSVETPRFFEWGWSTTPFLHNWNDDAVVRTNTMVGAPVWGEMTYLPEVPPYAALNQHPYLGRSVNMAYQLFSRVTPRRAYVWREPPDMILGTDLESWRHEPALPRIYRLRADDWLAEGRRVSNVHWWGSYIGWAHDRDGSELNPVPPPNGLANRPLGFNLSWHADSVTQPGTVITNLYVPLEYCHQTYYCCVTQFWQGSSYYEHEYQYYVDLLDPRVSGVPWNVATNIWYWLDIQALFAPTFVPGQDGHSGWGWKTTPQMQANPSVVSGDQGVTWSPGVYPLGHPLAGLQTDLSFELTTDQVGTNRWHVAPNIVAIVVPTNTTATVLVASVGDVLAGEQQLRMETALTNAAFNAAVDHRPVPFPPPWTNWFKTTVATNQVEFYRIHQVGP